MWLCQDNVNECSKLIFLYSIGLKQYFKDLRYGDVFLYMGIYPLEQQIQFYEVGVLYYSKVCLQYFKVAFQSGLIFRVP